MCEQARNFFVLSMLAYKEKQYDGAAKLFAAAMESEGLETLQAYVERMPTQSAIHDNANPSENTLSPSLASESSATSDSDLMVIVDQVERIFRSEASNLEDGDVLVETASTLEDEDSVEAASSDDDDFIVTASVGPITLGTNQQ